MYICAQSQLLVLPCTSTSARQTKNKDYKQVAMKGVVQLGPNPFQQIKKLSFATPASPVRESYLLDNNLYVFILANYDFSHIF